ncbi:MAG: sulfatase-like hydrolase/transferase, partial [Fuerstiella sp.]|nr:sulfatase-like hydrolase/transferase [Fuerstiella sp.]
MNLGAHKESTYLLTTRRYAIFAALLFTALPLRAAERPNVVMILADDQAYRDFGFMGNDQVHTPNIDRLAAASARYPNGYVPMSVCRPSLATFLTGLYPHQHGIHFNHPPPGLSVMRKTMTGAQYEQTRATTDRLIKNVATLPRILAQHGYACLQTGKHWEGSYGTAGFTHGMTLGKPANRLAAITGTRQQANGDWVAHGNGDAGLVIGRETMQPIYNFVADHAGRKPFFVWYAPFLPHTPFDAAQRYHDVYRDKQIPDHMRPYYAEIARFDETVGALVRHLDARRLLKNTLVVFASDNGFRPHRSRREAYNSHSKLSPFEDGL